MGAAITAADHQRGLLVGICGDQDQGRTRYRHQEVEENRKFTTPLPTPAVSVTIDLTSFAHKYNLKV